MSSSRYKPGSSTSASVASSSRSAGSSSQGSSSRTVHSVARGNADATMTELEDYFCALTLQLSMMTEDREAGQLGKAAVASDSQVAVEQMLQEARALEQSYMLAKSLAECDIVPDTLVDEMNHLDTIASSDRELAERLERCEYGAEVELRAKSERFERAIRYFYTAAECCTCIERKQTYTSPCGHAYCQDCAQSLYDFALTDRKLIPVRCCRMPFDSDIAPVCLMTEEDLNKYLTIKGEIEHPCPPVAELDRAASTLISEKGWKVCPRCGAVVDRAEGCVHMTCVCRHEFCYTCMQKWRTCTCELYPAEEINQILNERIGNDNPGPVRRRLQNVLRNYYQHEHSWEREDSLGRSCNVCDWAMPLYCLYCDECMETRCQRCCFNN